MQPSDKHDPKLQLMSTKDWEYLKERSKYHFRSDVVDPKFDTVTKVGKIPVTWTQEDLDFLEVNSQRLMGAEQEKDYDLENKGFIAGHVKINVSQQLPKSLREVEKAFCLEDGWSKIVIQKPGQLWPLHMDLLERFCPEDPSRVVRYVIHLTSWKPGQFWAYGNYQYAHWKAGDVTTFNWQDLPHCTANAGYHTRMTLQITGLRTDRSEDYINWL